jgi:nucleotide-binding universal stress UspA family protein
MKETPKGSETAKVVISEKGHKATVPAAALAPLQFRIGNILVPVDFSECAQTAVRYALGMASQFHAEVTLVHVVEQIIYPGDWMYPPLAMSDFAAEKRDQVLEKMQALVSEPSGKVNYVVRVGRAWQEVTDLAKETKADLLVLATHGYTGLKHVLLGSVAEKIVRHAPCPVLTVRPEERDFL